MKIVLASRTRKKIEELRTLLSQSFANIEILSLDDVGIYDDIEENGETFEEAYENGTISPHLTAAATSGFIMDFMRRTRLLISKPQ